MAKGLECYEESTAVSAGDEVGVSNNKKPRAKHKTKTESKKPQERILEGEGSTFWRHKSSQRGLLLFPRRPKGLFSLLSDLRIV